MNERDFCNFLAFSYAVILFLVLFGNIQGCVARIKYNEYTGSEKDRIVSEYICKGIGWPIVAGYGAYTSVFNSEWVKHEETVNVVFEEKE